jgi:hypothetical protein
VYNQHCHAAPLIFKSLKFEHFKLTKTSLKIGVSYSVSTHIPSIKSKTGLTTIHPSTHLDNSALFATKNCSQFSDKTW